MTNDERPTMAANDPTPNPPKSGGLWARLFSMAPEQSAKLEEPVLGQPIKPGPEGGGFSAPVDLLQEELDVVAEAVAGLFPATDNAMKKCPSCTALSPMAALYCGDCGWMFGESDNVPVGEAAPAAA